MFPSILLTLGKVVNQTDGLVLVLSSSMPIT